MMRAPILAPGAQQWQDYVIGYVSARI